VKKQVSNIAALYLRLSRDDGVDAESNSIGNQRMMLQRYAKEHGFQVFDEYIDDGYTGTNFERAGFKRMIEDIEAEKIGIVLVKDMSRLGRLNALVTYYTDLYFPDHDVRFIAVDDSIDTDKGDNDIMPFKSILNEYYAKDISKKVRSAKRTMALAGKHIGGHAPYGYVRSPEDKHKIVIDEEAADIVKRIFQMSASGIGYCTIATILSREKILTPAARESMREGKRMYSTVESTLPYEWQGTSVEHMLKNKMYLGHMINGRSSSKSYKNKKHVTHPESEWVIVENTHQAIIPEELYNEVQRICRIKKRPRKIGTIALFQTLMYCADCGHMMKFREDCKEGCYICGFNDKYRTTGDARRCTPHRIPSKVLTNMVLPSINWYIAQAHSPHFEENMLKAIEPARDTRTEKTLKREQRRLDELSAIIKKIIEKNALGIITDDTFQQLYAGYQKEQSEVSTRIERLEAERRKVVELRHGIEAFANLLKKYDGPLTVLSREVLLNLIDKIIVHEPIGTKWSKNKTHKIDIYYKGVGLCVH